jgi:hypothetical protein
MILFFSSRNFIGSRYIYSIILMSTVMRCVKKIEMQSGMVRVLVIETGQSLPARVRPGVCACPLQ